MLVLVLVPLSYSASLGQPRQCITCPGSYSYWSAKRGQICLVCPTPCAVRLGITGAEHTRPCWYLCWYLFRTVLRSACTVLRLVRTGHVPTCPCSHLYRYLSCGWTARALYLLARVLHVPTCPCLYRTYVSVLVSLYSVLLWVTRAMYVSSCLSSRAVTVSLLPLTWIVCW